MGHDNIDRFNALQNIHMDFNNNKMNSSSFTALHKFIINETDNTKREHNFQLFSIFYGAILSFSMQFYVTQS